MVQGGERVFGGCGQAAVVRDIRDHECEARKSRDDDQFHCTSSFSLLAKYTPVVPGERLERSRGGLVPPGVLSPVCLPIPSPRLEATEGFAPSHSGFADRRVASSPRGRDAILSSIRQF